MAERLSTGLADAINVTGSVKAIMANFIMDIYTGTQPATADAAETGTKIARITLDAGAFTSGVSTNGLNFGTSTGGVLSKAAAEAWKGIGLAACGTAGLQAGWFRAYANTVVTGASDTAVRFDGACGNSSSYELQLSTLNIVENAPIEITSFSYKTVKQ